MLTTKELEIMEYLWNDSPLSCAELMQNEKLKDCNKNAVYSVFKNLLKHKMIYVAEICLGLWTPTHLYAPLITEVDYIASQIESNPFYKSETMLPPLVQRLIGNIKKNEALAMLHQIVEQAENDLKWLSNFEVFLAHNKGDGENENEGLLLFGSS